MKKSSSSLAITMAWLVAMQPWMLQASNATGGADRQSGTQTAAAQALSGLQIEPRELTGFLDDRTAEFRAQRAQNRKVGLAEDGTPMAAAPFATLPIVDDKLASRVTQMSADDTLRVIVHLDYHPHEQVMRDVISSRQAEVDALEADRVAFLEDTASQRNMRAKVDAENYTSMFELDDRQRQVIRNIGERNEALSTAIKQEVSNRLRSLLEVSQQPVAEEIRNLGGNVEFTTVAGNMIIATLPVGAVDRLANVPGIMRIVEDSMIESHLTVADSSTMVDPADTSLSGLRDFGYDGGIYDPAVIDSGTDLSHPGMADNAGRANWCSWYLVAANGSANFDDEFSCDDLQSHGTHVAGIVGSYGTPIYPNHLGMSSGVEKMVHLKAGWLNSSNGRASMFWSDKFNLVDRALNDTGALIGSGNFADDVDGFNLSYGGSTTLDDTDGGRFWDSVISTYADTPVTISAGNSGPSNGNFNDPAVSYNAIVVANFNDRGTTSRNDDIISSSSTVGPTASGRRKPDLAAPGTSISAPNTFWETQSDYVNKSGTSMAAPMVLGVIMDLADAGVFDEKAVKALLLNTAQKNLPGMNIENDADGWDPQLGYGVMNAYAAFLHRFDVFQDSVTPRNTDGDYKLYRGVMRDEGSASGGEGRDRATLVWNRHATYLADAAPSTYYSNVDLNLRLYEEEDNRLIDVDLTGSDNTQQVRIDAGAGDTNVVINAYAWSSTFAHGGASEPFALATEEGFEAVDFPTQFQGVALWPASVEPGEIFDITFWVRNDSELASHNNVFNLELPANWTLISGTDTQNVGSAQVGEITDSVTYTLRAPLGAAVGAQTITVKHSHTSYNEPYGDFNWNMGLTVEVDNTPPSPNPMGFSTNPDDASTTSIDMVASFASDTQHNPVEYYLQSMGSPTGGFGGSSSGWQSSRTWLDDGLGVNENYCYRAWARDSASAANLTTPSGTLCAFTAQQRPAGVTFGNVTTTSIQVASSSLPANLTEGASGLLVQNESTGANSGWKQNNLFWTSNGLAPSTKYAFSATARNGEGESTGSSVSDTFYTLANPPAVVGLATTSPSSITVTLNANGNGSEAQYLIENTTAGTSSGWSNSLTWVSTGLACDSLHNFQAKARNGDDVETIYVPLGLQTTGACATDTDGDGVLDGDDNCTLIANPDQRDTNGDGYGNICDADLDNNGVINAVDLGLFRAVFFDAGDLDADFNGDGVVNPIDLGIIRASFFGTPGPSGLAP